jgi:DNA-binding beta-propeller fold protein YncE
MPLLVTSASGVNGDGYGALLAFDRNGAPLGVFCNDERIADPRGLVAHQGEGLLYLNSGQDRVLALDTRGTVVRDTGPIEGLNPGGGNFGPDGRYYVGLRSAHTVTAFPRTLDAPSEHFLAPGIVPFPRGFAFGRNGRLFLGSGIGPAGEGDNTILAFAPNNDMPSRLVSDPGLSPLDLAIAPNGNIVVASEYPFGAADAVTTVREYDAADGHLVRVFRPKDLAEFRRPRGLRFGPDGIGSASLAVRCDRPNAAPVAPPSRAAMKRKVAATVLDSRGYL